MRREDAPVSGASVPFGVVVVLVVTPFEAPDGVVVEFVDEAAVPLAPPVVLVDVPDAVPVFVLDAVPAGALVVAGCVVLGVAAGVSDVGLGGFVGAEGIELGCELPLFGETPAFGLVAVLPELVAVGFCGDCAATQSERQRTSRITGTGRVIIRTPEQRV
jgi:hypothetical protein